MTRLIDADALKEKICRSDVSTREKISNIIDNAPTVELFCHYQYDGEVKEPCVEGPCPHERPQGKCKDCKNYYSYYTQFTHKPRGDGYCSIAKMSSEGMTYINCTDSWSCADFCPKATAKNNG